jgi:hypothetical protein
MRSHHNHEDGFYITYRAMGRALHQSPLLAERRPTPIGRSRPKAACLFKNIAHTVEKRYGPTLLKNIIGLEMPTASGGINRNYRILQAYLRSKSLAPNR